MIRYYARVRMNGRLNEQRALLLHQHQSAKISKTLVKLVVKLRIRERQLDWLTGGQNDPLSQQ